MRMQESLARGREESWRLDPYTRLGFYPLLRKTGQQAAKERVVTDHIVFGSHKFLVSMRCCRAAFASKRMRID